MNERIFFSTGAFEEPALEGVIAVASREGTTHLELSSAVQCPPDVDAVRRALPAHFQYLVHNYFPPVDDDLVLNLASANADIHRRSLAFCRTAIDFAAAIGSRWYSVHSGFCADPDATQLGRTQSHLPCIDRETARRVFYRSLEELAAYSQKHGVHLCIENNVITRNNLVDGVNRLDLMTSPDDYAEFLTHPELGDIRLLMDVGHAMVSARTEGFDVHALLDVTRSRTAILHLSDNDGSADQNLPFDDDVWFAEAVERYAPTTRVVIESYRLSEAERSRCRAAVERMLA